MVGANKRHLLCMLVVCLVLLSASRCQARPSFMDSMVVGPAGLDADFFTRVGRQLQTATAVSSCPATQLPLQTSTIGPTITAGTITGVSYASLALPAGGAWGVVVPRPSSSNTAAMNTLFGKSDFWSVMCNGQGTTDNSIKAINKTKCTDATQGPLGATHIRYECGANKDSGTLWVLTYALADTDFRTTVGDMWITTPYLVASAKVFQVTGGPATSLAYSNDATLPGGASTWKVDKAYGITDGATWIGYMVKFIWTRPAAASSISETMKVHWDWDAGTSAQFPPPPGRSGGTSSSTMPAISDNTVCLTCTGIVCPTVSVTAPVDPPCYSGSRQVEFNFTVTSSDATAGSGRVVNAPGCTVSGPFGNIYTVRCSPNPINPVTATLDVTQTVSGCAVATDQKSATRTFCGYTCPSVTVTEPANVDCYDKASPTVRFNFTVTSSDTSVSQPVLQAIPSDKCTILGNISNIYTVECDRGTPGVSTDTFTTATLNVTQSVPGCPLATAQNFKTATECAPQSCPVSDFTLTGQGPTVCTTQGGTFTFVASYTGVGGLNTLSIMTPPAGCTAAVPPYVDQATTRTYTYTCPANTPSAGIVVKQANDPVNGESCDLTESTTASATLISPPTITVDPPTDLTACSTSDVPKTFTFHVKSSSGTPITITSVGPAEFCTYSGPATVPNDSDVPVVCSKPPGGWGTLTISLGTSAQPATAVPDCGTTKTTTASVTATPPPVVEVAAVSGPVCSDSPTSTSTWIVRNDPAIPMRVQLVVTPAVITCTMYQGSTIIQPNQDIVNSDNQITVVCQRPGLVWTAPNEVRLTATTTNDCPGSNFGSITINPSAKPVITVTAPDAPKVCSEDSTKNFTFTPKSSTGSDIIIESITPEWCVLFDPAATTVTSETPVIVQCTQPATGWTAPGESSFIVTLGTSTATQGVPGCGDTKSTPVTVQASVKPVVKVTLDSSPNVCSESPTSTSDWTVFSDIAASLNVFLEVTNSVECKLQDSNGADITGPVLNNTQVTVACTKPDPAGWPEAGYTVRVTATAGDADCLGSGQSDTTIYRSNKPVISVISVVGPTNPGLVLGKVCSEEQSKDFAFYLTSTTTSTITITDIKTTPTTTCQLFPTQTTPATVNNDTTVTVRCTKPADPATWATFVLTLETSTDTPGVANCGDTNSKQVTVEAFVKPVVTVALDSAPGVCSSSPTSTSNFTVTNDREQNVNVSLVVEPSTPAVSCHMEDSAGTTIADGDRVANNTQVTVKCTPDNPIAGWPVSYKVTLKATAGDASCPGSGQQDATIARSDKPTITIVPPTNLKVCSVDDSKDFLFTPSSIPALPTGIISIDTITTDPPTLCGLFPLLSIPTTVSSGSGVTVRCERPSTGWATFTLTLGTSTTTPDVANCGDTKSEQVTVQAYVKPAVTVSSDSAPGVCSESLNSDSTWTVSRDTEGTLDVTLEVTCTPTACTPNLECRLKDSSGNPITGPVANGTQITLNCDKPEGGWPAGYTAKVTATAGDATCPGSDFKEAAINRIIKPSLALTSPQSVPLCTDSTGPFSFEAEVTNTAAGSTETFRVNATWEGVDCVAVPYEAGPAATNVTITCPMPTGGYTAGSATKVTVKATAGATGCLDSKEVETTVAVTQKPTVGITGDSTRTVCADTTASFDLDYPTSWTPPSKTPTAAGVQPGYCSRVPDFTTNSGKITVTCTNSTQWPDDTFTVTVNGTVRDGICGGADTKSTTVTVNRKPGISLSVTQSPSNLCDNTGSVEFIYTVGLTPTGAEDSISVTMDPPAANSFVICGGPTKLTAGPNTGKWRVNCTGTSGGVLPAGTFTFKITAEAGAEGCKQTISEEKTVTTPGCCATGTDSSYAFGTALEDTTRLAFGTGTCFNNITEMNCGTTSNNWGWRNEFAGPGTGTFEIYAGGAVGCKNWRKMVGTITVSCANVVVDGKDASRVMMYMPQQALVAGADLSLLDHHMYVGCKEWAPLMSTTTTTNRKTGVKTTTTTASLDRSPTCTPPAYNAPKDSLSATFLTAFASGSGPKCGGSDADNTIMGASSPKGRCGGNCYNVLVPRSETTLQAATVASSGMLVEGCSCSGLYWVYHQSSKDNAKFTYDPVQGVC